MLSWLYLIVPIYIAYRTFRFANMVRIKEGNILAFVVLNIFSLGIVGMSVWLKMRG